MFFHLNLLSVFRGVLYSDNSQGQDGVDIYGPIDGGTAFSGIQCKNRKLNLIDGSPNRISNIDVQSEIEKAKKFKPALKKLIIATSLPKDKAIEEFVRLQSMEHVKVGLFTIQICFWEFFERKIPEFETVYNWYVKNEGFHRIKQLSVTFKDGSVEMTYHPKFQKTVDRYIIPPTNNTAPDINPYTSSLANLLQSDINKMMQPGYNSIFRSTLLLSNTIDWEQLCWLELLVSNIGQAVVEDYKIELSLEGFFEKAEPERGNVLFNPDFHNDIKGYRNSNSHLYIEPRKKILVQGDSFVTGSFYIQPAIAVEAEIKLNWKLLSRDFTDSGTLIVKIVPQYHVIINRHEVLDSTDVREEISYSLIKRKGTYNIGSIDYHDKESDYPVS
ncbi:hypothetical protein [Chitinophaga sancti]|uniref:Uncharacterized protein n=1 Tax=Chitinophaga sancti TaxID=1004 RepID=A0A1K1T2D0_9BACT|nr:hypothetical protein [Chitinophaga sancti]WQD59533.1 hypothetical protein U0033_16695 [Chitinophaga sancti]WQG88333.1 hypothetical protein SR876_25770 [Chitinophaga sancti]SFW90731.1 hypothetical protein SAMN05661012_06664 [Chitinophaga sancti]